MKEWDDNMNMVRDRLTILYFSALWCGPCGAMTPNIKKLDKEMDNRVDIYKVDVDTCPQMADAYHIMSIPTVIWIMDDEVIDIAIGAIPYDTLEQKTLALMK